MKKRTVPKVRPQDKRKEPEAEVADGPSFLVETDENAGIHILGKQDLERHFPTPEPAADKIRTSE